MKQKFKPAWWLPGPHLQTLWPAIFRRRSALSVRDERFELPDGDFLDLVWVGVGNGPLVLILHGLNGSVNSHYVNGLIQAITQRGWRAVLMHFRGCSNEPNRLARSYHSGETGDLSTVIAEITRREPNTALYAVGYSLGGNVLLKALGTCDITKTLQAAAAISIPFELAKTADHMSQGLSRIYQSHLVQGLKSKYKFKFKKIQPRLDFKIVDKLKTFWQFDDAITAPLHGFKNAADYYQQSSSRQFIKQIATPTLIVHAKDDPFTHISALPAQHEVSDQVQLELTEHGGHVGFVAGSLPWRPIYWLEDKILGFFEQHFKSLKL